MSIIGLVIILSFIGVGVYLFNTLVTMDGKYKTIINVIVGFAVALWLLSVFGLLPAGMTVPRLR